MLVAQLSILNRMLEESWMKTGLQIMPSPFASSVWFAGKSIPFVYLCPHIIIMEHLLLFVLLETKIRAINAYRSISFMWADWYTYILLVRLAKAVWLDTSSTGYKLTWSITGGSASLSHLIVTPGFTLSQDWCQKFTLTMGPHPGRNSNPSSHCCDPMHRSITELPLNAVTYPTMQWLTPQCSELPPQCSDLPHNAVSYPTMQWLTPQCSELPHNAVSYPTMQWLVVGNLR